MPTLARYGLALWLACCVAFAPPAALAEASKEYAVKAAFIYNFVKFVEWPDGKAIAKQSHIDICVVGDSPLADAADVFKTASTAQLSLNLVKEKNWKNAANHCHVVFIGSTTDSPSDIIAALKGQPVLTVSDIDGFAENGGMIGFVASDNKVKIEVNKKSLDSAGLRVDARLLEIALRVIDR